MSKREGEKKQNQEKKKEKEKEKESLRIWKERVIIFALYIFVVNETLTRSWYFPVTDVQIEGSPMNVVHVVRRWMTSHYPDNASEKNWIALSCMRLIYREISFHFTDDKILDDTIETTSSEDTEIQFEIEWVGLKFARVDVVWYVRSQIFLQSFQKNRLTSATDSRMILTRMKTISLLRNPSEISCVPCLTKRARENLHWILTCICGWYDVPVLCSICVYHVKSSEFKKKALLISKENLSYFEL